MSDEPAEGHPRERVEERKDGIEYRPTHVFEVDVDAFGASGLERLGEITSAVIDASVESELVDDVPTLALAAGDADRPATFVLGELTYDRPDRA